MNHRMVVVVATCLLLGCGCQSVSPAPVDKPTGGATNAAAVDAKSQSQVIPGRATCTVRFDPSVAHECVVEILLGKDVAYRDSFVTRAETAQNGGTASARDGLLIDFVPESSPDLSKAKRMAYGLSLIADSGAYFAVGHKVRNPFEGMAVHREISNPTVQYGSPFPAYVCWRNTDNVKGKPDAVVQVTFSKATPAQIAAQRTKPNNAVHEESPWANAKT